MMDGQDYLGILRRSLLALALGLAAVTACFFWVDRPTAFFVAGHGINKYEVFRWLTFPPPVAQSWSPMVLVVLMVRRAVGPLTHCQKTLFVACLSLLVADQFRASLGDLCGRYWPETWYNNNPSLIGTGAYGFHPFVHGDDVGSFPSGHAARILGFAAVWWNAVPRSRALCLIVCPPMLVSLVAMDYHFVGDVLAGGVLGGIVGAYSVRLADLQTPKSSKEA